jgi:hypothetical protein
MAKLHEFMLRFKALFARRRMDREMAEELDFHQAMLREKLLRQGVPEASVEGRHGECLAIQCDGMSDCGSSGSFERWRIC